MAKVIKIAESSAVVLKDNGETIDVPLDSFTYLPDNGDEVDVHKHGDNLIINKRSVSNNDKVNINIVNENNQHQNMSVPQQITGKLVNK